MVKENNVALSSIYPEPVEGKGMKQTELGLLPEDWEVINLEENFTLKARIGWQGLTTAEYLEHGNYGLVTGTDFKNGYIDWDNCVFVQKMRFDQDRNIQLKNGDVLVTKDGTIGKIAYIDFLPKPTTLNSGVFVLRPKLKNVNNRFFYYILMSFYFDDFLFKITAGSTITHLYQKDFVNFNFICPPLAEQEAIAEALTDADAWIESLEQLIAKKRRIKQGAMQKLLAPKKDWEVKKLGEVFKLKQGVQCGVEKQFKNYNPELVRFIRIVDVTQRNTEARFINDPGIEHHIDCNDLFMVRYGAPGIIGFNYEGVIANNLFRLIPKIEIFNPYFKYFFDFIKSTLAEISSSSTMAALNFTTLNNIDLFFPSLTEQTHIATILSDMDAELEALEAQLAKARRVKQGMMQELLTGRVRLV